MIFIIGVKHEIQFLSDCNSTSIEEFQEYLKTEAINRRVILIAEELSNEVICNQAKFVRKEVSSVAKAVALSIGINHKFCDPDSKKREELGIPSETQIRKELGLGVALSHSGVKKLDREKAKYYHVREEYWFSLIEDHASLNLIFICGDDHVDGFEKLVANYGYPTKVLLRQEKHVSKSVL